MSDRSNRRKTLVVEKQLQWRMVVEQAWPAALTMLITAAVMCFFVSRVAQESMELAVDLPSLPWVIGTALAFLVVSTAIIAYCALRFSHRVAGPVYSIRRSLRAFREGDSNARVKLRNGDFLMELADDMNAVLELAASSGKAVETPAKGSAGDAAFEAAPVHADTAEE